MNGGDPWQSGLPYEPFMGRWSRRIAPLFLDWLALPGGLRWLDVGCGTGALCAQIARQARPRDVLGIDPSPEFIAHARETAQAIPRLRFEVAGAEAIPARDGSFDVAVSALALNFFPDIRAGLVEMRRVVKSGRAIAAYVWDYAAGMQMLRVFWDAVVSLDPDALPLDEKVRFPVCQPDAQETTFAQAGLVGLEVRPLETPTVFESFDDYWQPFLGGVGPAPGYVAALSPGHRARLEAALRGALPIQPDGSIPLTARAWAIRARA